MIETAEKAVALLARRDMLVPDRNGSGDGSTTIIQESETTNNHISGINDSQDIRLRFNIEDQRYRKRGPHMHPQGLVSEPDLHIPSPE